MYNIMNDNENSSWVLMAGYQRSVKYAQDNLSAVNLFNLDDGADAAPLNPR